jgi:hypothetical protein
MGIHIRHEVFLSYYIGEANFNGREAAKLAGYQGDDNNLRVMASQILKESAVRERLWECMREEGITVPEVLYRLSAIARGNLADFINFDDESEAWNIDIRKAKKNGKMYALETLKRNRYGIEIKLADRIAALEKLARIHGMLQNHSDVNVQVTNVNVITDDERKQRLLELVERAELRKVIAAEEERTGEVIDIELE